MIFKKRSIGILLTSTLALVGCETTKPEPTLKVAGPFSSLKANKQVSPPVAHAINLLKEEKYTEASQFLNQALQSQPKNPVFHILNGLAYEKLAERGDATGLELACIGYQNAINLDPSNVFAITQLAKIHYNEKRFDEAQENFANALLITPNDSDLLHELAAASYYAYDIKTALSAINKAETLKPDDALIQRSSAMIHAALGDFNTAKKHLAVFQRKMGDDPAVHQLTARVNDWQNLYQSGRIKLTPATYPGGPAVIPGGRGSGGGGEGPPPGAGGGGGEGPPPGGAAGPYGTGGFASGVLGSPISTEEAPNAHGPQIVVDCYLLRITEDARTSKGNNILQNLAVTLNPGGYSMFKADLSGSGVPTLASNTGTPDNLNYTADSGFNTINNTGQVPPAGQAASIFNPSVSSINLGNQGSLSGSVFASGITWAGLTYSLNIANAIDNRTEIVSRPSLMTFLNKQSVFFSGNELVIGLAGQFGGTLVKYPIGVTLLVTPESLEGDILTLNIAIEGSIFTTTNPNLQTTVNVGKTRVDTFAKLRLGETLMLGGIYERLEVSTTNGFPGLQDIPIVQYFFSNESTASTRRSIVFMLTPRSPDAVKAAVNRALSREATQTPHLSELKNRNRDWFNTHPNLITIFRYLEKDPIIYYEFRTGDILPPSWGWELSTRNKLAQIESFLYY